MISMHNSSGMINSCVCDAWGDMPKQYGKIAPISDGEPVFSELNLGQLAKDTGDPLEQQRVYAYLSFAAARGSVEAAYQYAVYGMFSPRDLCHDPLGFVSLQKAAFQKFPKALALLGYFYLRGVEDLLQRDEQKAVQLIAQAVELGNTESMNNLAVMHAEGLGGLLKNQDMAIQLFRKASENGSREASINLEIIKVSENGCNNQREVAEGWQCDVSVSGFVYQDPNHDGWWKRSPYW
jgi:TPR repeat protein